MSWPQSPAMVGAGAQGVATAHSPVQSPEDGGLENAQDAAGTTLVRTAAAILPTWPATPVLSQIRLGQVQLAAERMSQLRPSASPLKPLGPDLRYGGDAAVGCGFGSGAADETTSEMHRMNTQSAAATSPDRSCTETLGSIEGFVVL